MQSEIKSVPHCTARRSCDPLVIVSDHGSLLLVIGGGGLSGLGEEVTVRIKGRRCEGQKQQGLARLGIIGCWAKGGLRVETEGGGR